MQQQLVAAPGEAEDAPNAAQLRILERQAGQVAVDKGEDKERGMPSLVQRTPSLPLSPGRDRLVTVFNGSLDQELIRPVRQPAPLLSGLTPTHRPVSAVGALSSTRPARIE